MAENEKAFLVDAEKCTSCKLCIIACKDEHVDNSYAPWTGPQPETGHFWVDVIPLERGRIPRVKMSYLPVFCQHCEDAPCIPACPEAAIKTRDDGLVWIDDQLCTGCGDCGPACPYDVIFMNDELNVAQKCTGCAHRVDEGLEPRCVDICPHDAILFGDAKGPLFADDGLKKSLEEFHPEYKAAPRTRWRGLPRPWIAGTLVDEKAGEIVAGAQITASRKKGGQQIFIQSDAFGDFWIKDLQEGDSYEIAIHKAGYKKIETSIDLSGDHDLGTLAMNSA